MNEAENVQMCVTKGEIDSAMGRVLRIMLANNQPTVQHELRQKALVGAENDNSKKCIVDLALLTLVEHGLLTRHGYGNWALYTVQQESLPHAIDLAYAEFPSENPDSQQQATVGYAPLPGATPCGFAAALRRPASPRSRNSRSLNSDTRMQPLHRVRASAKRSNCSSNSSGMPDDAGWPQCQGGAKRAKLTRLPSFSAGPAPMSP